MSEIEQMIAGNWKMNLTLSQGREFMRRLRELVLQSRPRRRLLLAPNFTLLSTLAGLCDELGISLAAQNCAPQESGAFTGETSVAMIKEAGAGYVIVGHSERRHLFNEDDGVLRCKLQAVAGAGLVPIFCVGETLAQRQAGRAAAVVLEQLESGLEGFAGQDLVVAYEPVWAIGTGQTATPDDARRMHVEIRNFLTRRFADGGAVAILYGGSAKPQNAASLLSQPEVDGLLVGGASLDPEAFWQIAMA